MLKRCVTCKQEKSSECFSKDRSSKDGLKLYCKECARMYTAKYRAAHREEINQRKRDAYEREKARKEERTRIQLDRGPKTCSVCGEEKPLSEFYPRGNGGFYARCKACERKAQDEARFADPEKRKEQKRESYLRNLEHVRTYNRKYYEEHSDEIAKRVKDWRTENPDRHRETHALTEQRRRSRKKGTQSTLTKTEWNAVKAFFSDEEGCFCAYCGVHTSALTQDHVIPLSKGGDHSAHNIVPACRTCNTRKATKDIWDWYEEQPFFSEERKQKILEYIRM